MRTVTAWWAKVRLVRLVRRLLTTFYPYMVC